MSEAWQQWQRLSEAAIALEDASENDGDVTVLLTAEQQQALLELAYTAIATKPPGRWQRSTQKQDKT